MSIDTLTSGFAAAAGAMLTSVGLATRRVLPATVPHVDAAVATLLGAILGGILTVAGGIGGTFLLASQEQRREAQRQRERHATAVRVVVLELQLNGAMLSMHAAGLTYARTSTSGHDSVATDLYSLLPADLASDISIAYVFTSRIPPDSGMAKLTQDRVARSYKALRAYAEKEFGLEFGASKLALSETELAALAGMPQPAEPPAEPSQK